MIYVDTSVLLAYLLLEDVRPKDEFWGRDLTTSRLSSYEIWVRLNAKGRALSHADAAHSLLGSLTMVELEPDVLARANETFLAPVRTLDALHLATFHYLLKKTPGLELASYDKRMKEAAEKLGFKIFSFK